MGMASADGAPKRVVAIVRITTNHPIPAHGGLRLPDHILEALAEAAGKDQIPMVINHDRSKPLNSRCIRVAVVDLPDGFKAVEGEFEVDADAWASYEEGLRATGAPGGMSFTFADMFLEVTAKVSEESVSFELAGDVGYFDDATLAEGARQLASAGTVRVGRLYQFSYEPACRIIIQIQQGGAPPLVQGAIAAISGTLSIVLYNCLALLLRKRRASATSPTQIELHTRQDPDGSTSQVLQVRTDSEDVLKHAIDKLCDAMTRPDKHLEWESDLDDWRAP